MMIAMPIYFQMVFEYTAMETGFALAPFSLSIFAIAILAGRRAGNRRASRIIQVGFGILFVGIALLIPFIPRADSGWSFLIPLAITGTGIGLLVSQLNNYTLSPISDERVSEAAGVNSAAGSFGLSFGLAFAGAMMLAALSLTFTNMAQSSTVLTPDQQTQVAQALEEDAQIMSNTQLEEQLANQPAEIQAEIIRINTDARNIALQVALMVPLIAGLLGLLNSFRMVKLPDLEPSSSAEGMLLG
jgi:MFS family permease